VKTLYNCGLFQLSKEHYYEVPGWAKFDWLRHGFGTRDSKPPREPLATVKQVHGNDVRVVEQSGQLGQADGLISGTPGLLVGVKTADCLPILLVDPVHRVVSAVHAGWRGTAAEILTKAVELSTARFGSDPAQMEAAIGPGIGICCFEVGPEVAREFGAWESEEKTCLDLAKINRAQLERAGIKTIFESGLCTMCGKGFYSFRREREQAGRMLSFVGNVG
jgi:polyphenol oxidase